MTEIIPNGIPNGEAVPQPNAPAGDARYYTGIDWVSLIFRLLENIHWILLAALLCCAAVGLWVKTTETPIYQTTSKLYIAGSETTISLSDIQLGSSLAKDYQEVFKIWHVHEMVDERLGLNYSYSKLSGMISVSNPDGSHLLYINARSSDPEEAKLLADTYAEVVQEFIADKMELRKPHLLEVAQLPTRPISPDIKMSMLKGFLAGGFLAAAVTVFLLLIDDKIRTSDDIEKATGLATLGVLAKQEKKDKGALPVRAAYAPGDHLAVIRRDPTLEYAGEESINAICSGIMFAGKNLRRIAITSHDENNGKTFIAMRLACSMAKRGKKVLLIDADLRKSVLLGQYRIAHTDKGLAHFLAGQATLEEAVYPTNIENLYLLPAGRNIQTPLPLLTSADFEELMDYVGGAFDVVLVDTPPVGAVIDAAEVARRCDGSLLVLEYNKQTQGSLRAMQRLMEQTQKPIIGCVINNVTVKGLSQKRYYSQYGCSYLGYYGKSAGQKRKKSAARNGGKKK